MNEPPLGWTKPALVKLIVRIADLFVIPRRLLLACALAEGGRALNPYARRPVNPNKYQIYWNPPDPFDVSFGLCQQIVRFMPEYLAWCAETGHDPDAFPGADVIERLAEIYFDPERALTVAARNLHEKRLSYWAAGDDFRTLCLYNWPNGKGEPYTPKHAENYSTALVEADQILGAPAVPSTVFNPNIPVILQRLSWTCSAVTLAQMLNSIGRPTTESDGVAILGPSRIGVDIGLLLATGEGFAAALAEQGLDAGYTSGVTWEYAITLAGTRPLALGGRRWGEAGHWAFCYGYDAAREVLLFKNSASDYLSEMTRDQFNARGSWSAVWINVAENADLNARLDAAEAERDQVAADLKVAQTTIGYLTHEVVAALRKELDAIKASMSALEAATDTLARHAA